MRTQTEIIKIERNSCGYELTINDWFIDNFRSFEKLLAYLNDRLRSDFH
jgi:hypothetical protein